jgi:hypothetical protein
MDAVPLAIKLLQATAMSQAGNERLDLGALGAELDVPELALRQDMDQLIAAGLMFANEDGSDPMLLNAGRQYISRGAAVPRDELWFLPQTIDDLNARRALLLAGRTLVDEFRAEVLNDAGVEYARRLVPSGFATAVDERLALDLYAATVALMARLSNGHPAGCVAEEIVAVALIGMATMLLEMDVDEETLTDDEASAAVDELRSLFELFEDDDVLAMFDMEEPADAAVAALDPGRLETGVVDQRLEAWFRPFGGASPTGYLAEASEERED